MTRILFWVALAFLVVAAIRAKLRANARSQQKAQSQHQERAARRPAAPPAVTAEPMLCCAHCGMYYPASENVPAAGRDYCSAAHTPAH